jgi:hypothetical protein
MLENLGAKVRNQINFKNSANMFFGAIELCFSNEFITPSLVLIYSTIDIMAWLDRDKNHTDVQESDFKKWVETYLLPNLKTSCTSTDIYGARCSLLHSGSAESRKSREGKASEIYYSWGNKKEENLRKILKKTGRKSIRVLHVNKLIQSLKIGVENFVQAKQNDPIVLTRAGKILAKMPENEIGIITKRLKLSPEYKIPSRRS